MLWVSSQLDLCLSELLCVCVNEKISDGRSVTDNTQSPDYQSRAERMFQGRAVCLIFWIQRVKGLASNPC